MPELIVETEKVPKQMMKSLEIDFYVDYSTRVVGSPESHDQISERKFYKFHHDDWINKLSSLGLKNSHIFYFKPSGEKVQVSFDSSDSANICEFVSREFIAVKTCMHFEFVPFAEGTENAAPLKKYVDSSFKHDLTIIGKRSLNILKQELNSRAKEWHETTTQLIAPVVSLCQSSGTGKSKLAIELLKSNPGFYIVFREKGQTGNPRQNELSKLLYQLVLNFSDDISAQNMSSCTNSSIGKILIFFAKLLTAYVSEIAKNASLAILNRNESIEVFDKSNVMAEIKNFGKLFEMNDVMDTFIAEFSNRKYPVFFETPEAKVSDVADYISDLLSNPVKYVPIDTESCHRELNTKFGSSVQLKQVLDYIELKKKACSFFELILERFPLIFVLDEVDILSKIPVRIILPLKKDSGKFMSGFEALRRALSYLNNSPSLFFLTLATKSTVIDINPPVVDISSRYLERKKVSKPIILPSNSNIFAKEYPISSLKPSSELLSNPIFFKFLTSLGRALWGCYPFFSVVNSAVMKMQNGSKDNVDYFIPAWMILTSFAANPLQSDASSLVAKHMATLLDLSKDINKLTVAYPSEPILALAAMELISGGNFNSTLNQFPSESLFSALQEKFEGTMIDRGEMSESFVALMVLRALKITPSCAKVCDKNKYDSLLEDIVELCPAFASLWKTRANLLEDGINESVSNDDRLKTFPNFPAHKVRDFLKVWTGITSINGFESLIKDMEIDEDVLDGIVNATHFVRLNRDENGFKNPEIDILLSAKDIPLADSRLDDKSRNVIDSALLSYGLLKTCGFFTPAGSFGIDLILPVCMNNGGVTMIAIQVKTAQANFSNDTFKMQARWNFVKCSTCQKFSDTSCAKCTPVDQLNKMFYNQISLLVSLGEDESRSFRNQKQFYNGCDENDHDVLLSSLKSKPKVPLTLKKRNKAFFKPLVKKNIVLEKSLVLSTAFWADEACEMIPVNFKDPKLDLEKEINKSSSQTSLSSKAESQSTLVPASTLQSGSRSKTQSSESISSKTGHSKPKPTAPAPPEIPRDNMYHRQFTFCSFGWSLFERLFINGNNCATMAKHILSSEGIYRARSSKVEARILRSVVHDISPTYFQYSDDLLSMRELDHSNLDKIDKQLKILPQEDITMAESEAVSQEGSTSDMELD